MKWKNLTISTNNIEISTEKSVLIKMPSNSCFAGFMFWHPAKLIRRGEHPYVKRMSYTEQFEFRLFKNGNGRFNYNKKIAEKTISAEEMEKAMEMMDTSFRKPDPYETHIPEKLEPIKAETLEELKDD